MTTNLSLSPSLPVDLLAARPRRVEDTGLSKEYLGDLLLKHLQNSGVLGLSVLVKRIALSGAIVEEITQFLRTEGMVEVRGSGDDGLRFALTDRGRAEALDALHRSSYVGPAPVPLEIYRQMVDAQSVRHTDVTKQAIQEAFSGFVIREAMLDQLGPAMRSNRAIFIYGPAGTGKTYVTKRLMKLLSDSVLIPYAISVNESAIPLFDPVVHELADDDGHSGLMLEQGHDPRYARCKRPAIVTGGELTLDMLNLSFDPINKDYRVPLQLKANNGLLLIDDLGRQQTPTMDLLNRWIVPMEEQHDYLSLGSGKQFQVPFDLVLFFSTNMNPLDLADDAFLRRLGYKIQFHHLTQEEYVKIWWQVCRENDIECDTDALTFALKDRHEKRGVKLLPCHPRDLLGLAVDRSRYLGDSKVITTDHISWAWDSYFINLKDAS